MKKSLGLSLLLILLSGLTYTYAQKVTLSGYIRDAESGEDLIGATVFVKETASGASTNLYGFYSISLPPGTYQMTFQFLGYNSQQLTIDLKESKTLNVELGSAIKELKTVEIAGEREDQNVTGVEMSVEKMDMETVKKIPQLLGEADIVRSIQLLPGVTTVGEGATGFNVRGGNVDQNLILLDEAPVYNSSHLFGFFSVFNSDAIKDSKLYKGGIPARYGGRLSSVMDVRQREGNSKKLSGSGGVSIISSRLTIEAPIIKDKSSFMIAGRRSYGDLALNLFPNLRGNVAFFYDLNAKANYKLNDKNRLFLSGYFGRDVFKFGDAFETNWGNSTASLRWNHLFSDKLFSNFTAIFSDFDYSLGVPTGSQAFIWESHVLNYNLKADFSLFPNPNNTIEFGAQALLYRFQPGNARGVGDNTIFNEIDIEHERAFEPAVYISNEQKVGKKVTLQYGLRYSMFANFGKGTVFSYATGSPNDLNGDANAITDTTDYDRFEIIELYQGLEPRFSVNYLLDSVSSLKASYNRTRQYIHLVSNTTSATPLDIWTPSGKFVEPAILDQVAVGYFRNFADNTYEGSVEVYYKDFDNLLDYVDGAELLLNETLETELKQGQGRAYGVEMQVKRKKGRVTGWVSYTLARTERKVAGINNGEYYPSNYDKTHDISFVGVFSLNDRWDLSANFAYQTGRPITYPDSRYVYEGIVIPNYNNRNGARTPDYHRLDFSATYDFKGNVSRRWKHSLVFGVYNVYGRRNPYSIFFRQNEDNPQQTEAVRLSIFGSVIPSVTYNFKF